MLTGKARSMSCRAVSETDFTWVKLWPGKLACKDVPDISSEEKKRFNTL
jgi:hypothetical protein